MTTVSRGTAAAALAAFVAAGCGGGSADPVRTPPAATVPAPQSVPVTGHAQPSASARPLSVLPPPGTRALHQQVRGRGRGQLGTFAVPARYAVVIGCVGTGELVLLIDRYDDLRMPCHERADEVVVLKERPRGARSVRIAVRAGKGVRWAVVVTTDPGVPK